VVPPPFEPYARYIATPCRSFPGGGGYNIPSQYARPRAQCLRVAVTSQVRASDMIMTQSKGLFSHPAMIVLPRALVTV
jgi:hypothetical protein